MSQRGLDEHRRWMNQTYEHLHIGVPGPDRTEAPIWQAGAIGAQELGKIDLAAVDSEQVMELEVLNRIAGQLQAGEVFLCSSCHTVRSRSAYHGRDEHGAPHCIACVDADRELRARLARGGMGL